MHSGPNLAIVVLHYNGVADTERCLESLTRNLGENDLVVIVDNASREPVADLLRSRFPNCHFVRNDVNGGWAGGNNVGIRWALAHDAELVVLLNNDTVVTADFCSRMRDAADRHAGFGVLGPVINSLDAPGQVMTDGCVFNRRDDRGFFQRRVAPLEGPESVTEVDIVNGCCMLIRREVFDRIGLIDERFFLIHEEADFCLRARAAAFRCAVVGETLVWHKGSSSFRQTGRGWQRYYDARNLHLLLRRHRGQDPNARSWSRSWIEYYRYLYHRFSHEIEGGEAVAANRVLEGLCDAWAGRFGSLTDRRRWLLAPLRCFFGGMHRLKQGPVPAPPAQIPAKSA